MMQVIRGIKGYSGDKGDYVVLLGRLICSWLLGSLWAVMGL